MEMGNPGELFGLVGVTADNTTAITEDTNDAAVFPVGDLIYIRQLQLAQNIPACGVFLGLPLKVLDKTRPRATFQLVQQRRVMLWHLKLLLNGLLFTTQHCQVNERT